MQILKAEFKSWMLGEFASLKSKHDDGVAEAVKQSFLHCHCEPKARQSFLLHINRLPRRYAPRNDDVVASNGLPRRYAPRNDDGVASNGLPRRYAPRNDDNTSQCHSMLWTSVHSQRIQDTYTVFLKRINHTGCSTNWLSPKVKHDCNVCGRSMIEMLGVLAIIGVLSVGGLAGYSKAMSKWQENKQLEQISMLLYNTLDTMDYFSQEVKSGKSGYGVSILAAIDRIPEGLSVKGDFVYDTYGNRFSIYYGIGTCRQADGSIGPCKLNMQSYIGIRLKQNGSSFALTSETQCHNIIKAAQAFQEYLRSLEMRNSNSENINGYDVSKVIYGKQLCQKSSNLCFNNITPVQIDAFCKSCATETCGLVLYLVVR